MKNRLSRPRDSPPVEAPTDHHLLVKKIQINFEELVVAAIYNKIHILEPKSLKPMEILGGHDSLIRGLDISQAQKIIVSISETCFTLHCLVESDPVTDQIQDEQNEKPRILQDQAIYTGQLKWELTYKTEIVGLTVRSLAVSPLGDFCVLAGDQSVSVWTQDSNLDSFTEAILYTKDEQPNHVSQIVDQVENLTGSVTQTEICGSGRLFATLEKGDRSLKIWHQDDASLEAPSSDIKVRRYHYADLAVYNLPRHRQNIERFQFLHQEPNATRMQPSCVMTVCQKNAFLWVESLELQEMAFNCVKSFSIALDACFVQLPTLTPTSDLAPFETRYEASKLFQSYKDQEKIYKKNVVPGNQFGLQPSNLPRREASLDWVLLVQRDHLQIAQCRGVRNVPSRSVECDVVRRIDFEQSMLKSMTTSRLLFAWCRGFDDQIEILGTEPTGNMLKYACDARQVGDQEPKAKLQVAVKLNSRGKVSQMLVHPCLPLVALVYAELRMIQVYMLGEGTHPRIRKPDFVLQAAYKMPSEPREVKWAGNLNQLLVLTADNKVELISSTQCLKIVSLFGQKSALQDEVYRGRNSKGGELETYSKVGEVSAFPDDKADHVFFVDQQVRAADQPNSSPSQTVVFAVISSTGRRQLHKVSFRVARDSKICDFSHAALGGAKSAFAGGFLLSNVVGTSERQQLTSAGKPVTYVLCLTQKANEVKTAGGAPAKKPHASLALVAFTAQGCQDVWSAPGTAEDLLERPVFAKFGRGLLGILVSQGNYHTESQYLYLYNLESQSYSGFLDLNKLLDVDTKKAPTDFCFLDDKIKGAIALMSRDDVYLLGQRQNDWALLHKQAALTDLHPREMFDALRFEQINSCRGDQQRAYVSLINDSHLVAFASPELLADPSDALQVAEQASVHQLFAEKQRSQSLFHPNLLSELYYKGYGMLVVKILVKLKDILQKEQESGSPISGYLDMNLSTLLTELKAQSEAVSLGVSGQAPAAAGKGKGKKQTAMSVFDDLEASSSEEEQKEEEKVDDAGDIKQKFRDGAEELVQLLQNKSATVILGLDRERVLQLITFTLKFRNIFEIDFQTDPLASMLLRRVFCETEKLDQEALEQTKKQLTENEREKAAESGNQLDIMNYEAKAVKPFSMEDFMAQYSGNHAQAKSDGDLSLISDWTSSMVCQAMHSVDQDEILKRLSERFEFAKNLDWATMRRLSIPVWIGKLHSEKLKQLIMYIAENEYKNARDDRSRTAPSAEYAALWYILLKKLQVLQKLYKVEPGQEKFAAFFSKDFTEKKVQSIAGKNATALIPKQKYHLSCGFFILGQNLADACQIAVDRCKDPVLAVLMCRIFDPENGTGEIDKVAQKWFIERGEKFNDPFLINIGYWLKKEFVQAVNQLSPTMEDNCLNYLYNNTVAEFDLVPASGKANQAEATTTVYPTVSKRSYLILDLVKKLEKSPDVKRALNKNWTLAIDRKPGKGAAPSIFDDFLGGGSDSSSEEKEEEKKEAIEVDEAQVLTHAIKQTLAQRQTIIGLLLMEENRTLLQKVDGAMTLKLAQTILMDLVVNIMQTGADNYHEAVTSIRSGSELLSALLSISREICTDFVLTQLRRLGLFKIHVNFLIDDQSVQTGNLSQLMCIEDETNKLWQLIHASCSYGGFSLNALDFNPQANRDMLPLVEHLEVIVDCMLLQGFQSNLQQAPSQPHDHSPLIQGTTAASPSPSKAAQSRRALGEDAEIDAVAEDSDEAAALRNPRSTITNSATNPRRESQQRTQGLNRAQHQVAAGGERDDEIWDPDEEDQKPDGRQFAINMICTKFRSGMTLIACLCQLAMLTAKYNQFREFFEELQKIMGISAFGAQLDTHGITEGQLDQLLQVFQFQKMKVLVKKLKMTVTRNIEYYGQPLAYDDSTRPRRKPARTVDSKQEQYDFVDIWLRSVMASHLAALFMNKQLRNYKVLNSTIIDSHKVTDMPKLQQIFLQSASKACMGRLSDMFTQLETGLERMATYTLRRMVEPADRPFVVSALEKIIESKYATTRVKGFNFEYFLSNPAKLKQFAVCVDLGGKFDLLKDYQLSLIGSSDSSVDRETTEHLAEGLLQGGVELFKQRQEQVVDLCFDHSQNDMVAFAMQARGMREISVLDTLIYRNRVAGGLEVVDEDQLSWSECLHRYEPIQAVHQNLKPKTESIRATIGSLYAHTMTGSSTKQQRKHNILIQDQEPSPPQSWDDTPSSYYSKSYSQHLITHDDYTNAVEAHPHLPLYVSGNAKGLVCLWNFNQMTDKSLNQWILDKDTPPAQANPKKATVRKLAFSSYGNKLAAINTGGHMFVMNFDLQEHSKYEPLFGTISHVQRNSASDARLTDFAFLNSDSIIAGVSLKDKMFNIYDTLLPPRQCVVQSHKGNGGNLLQVCSDKQRIYCFNAKPGTIHEYDLRKQDQAVSQRQLYKEEITAVTINKTQDSLIVGTNAGVVKIYDLTKGNFDEKASINAFTNVLGQKGAVSRVRIHPHNGGLFATSNVGCLKLLRLDV